MVFYPLQSLNHHPPQQTESPFPCMSLEIRHERCLRAFVLFSSNFLFQRLINRDPSFNLIFKFLGTPKTSLDEDLGDLHVIHYALRAGGSGPKVIWYTVQKFICQLRSELEGKSCGPCCMGVRHGGVENACWSPNAEGLSNGNTQYIVPCINKSGMMQTH